MGRVYGKKTDSNQKDIVKYLKTIPGVSVITDHDDILVGYKGRTYWFEIKNPDEVGKDGKVKPSAIRKSQKELLDTWTGHYQIVWNVDQILKTLGIEYEVALI